FISFIKVCLLIVRKDFGRIMLIIMFLFWLLNLIGVLVGVAFITLFERRILGYIQYRKGPNRASFYGVFQPIAEALKLFFKVFSGLIKGNMFIFIVGPAIGIFLSLLVWVVTPYRLNFIDI